METIRIGSLVPRSQLRPKQTSQPILSLPSFPGSGAHFFSKGHFPTENARRFVP